MSTSPWETYVQCPFYRYDDGRYRVTCEGILEGSNITQFYRKRRDLKLQMEVFCCDHFKKCEIYNVLLSKYEDQ